MNNKQRLLAGALLLGGGVVLGTLAINMAENSTNKAQQMSPAVQGKVLQPSEQSAIPVKEDSLAPVELKELPHGGSPSVVNTAAEQMAKKAEIDRLSRHYQDAEQKAQDAQRAAAQHTQWQQALDAQKKPSLLPDVNQAEKQRQAELLAKAEAEKKRLAEQEAQRKAEAEKKRLVEQTTDVDKKRQLELAKAEAEKKRLAEQAEAKRKAEAEKKRQEQLKADADKKRQADIEAKRKEDAEKKRKAELAKNEAEKKRLAEQAEAKRKAEAEKKAELEKKRKAEQAKKDKSSPQNHAQWMVQIALADKENASAMAGKLRSKGYRVTLSPTSKGVRVLVGPHKDRAAADSVRQRIAGDGSLNMRSAWVHSWVPLEYRK